MKQGQHPGEEPSPKEASVSFVSREILQQKLEKYLYVKCNLTIDIYLSKQNIEEALINSAWLILGQRRVGVAREGQVVEDV